MPLSPEVVFNCLSSVKFKLIRLTPISSTNMAVNWTVLKESFKNTKAMIVVTKTRPLLKGTTPHRLFPGSVL